MVDNDKTKKVEQEETEEERLRKVIKASEDKKKKVSGDPKKNLATRTKLERDYIEDTLDVTFNTSSETQRTVKARKPNKEEFLQLLKLNLDATRFEGAGDTESLQGIIEVYEKMDKLAADLTIDKTLNEEFWSKHVSFDTLQSFIGELIIASQTGGITEDDLNKFR